MVSILRKIATSFDHAFQSGYNTPLNNPNAPAKNASIASSDIKPGFPRARPFQICNPFRTPGHNSERGENLNKKQQAGRLGTNALPVIHKGRRKKKKTCTTQESKPTPPIPVDPSVYRLVGCK